MDNIFINRMRENRRWYVEMSLIFGLLRSGALKRKPQHIALTLSGSSDRDNKVEALSKHFQTVGNRIGFVLRVKDRRIRQSQPGKKIHEIDRIAGVASR